MLFFLLCGPFVHSESLDVFLKFFNLLESIDLCLQGVWKLQADFSKSFTNSKRTWKKKKARVEESLKVPFCGRKT